MKKVRAVALFSGGLDSILALKIVSKQNVKIFPITFITPFSLFIKFGKTTEITEISKNLSINTKVVFLGEEFIKMVKTPIHGYGKNMNPCLDCRIMMLKKARNYMQEITGDFIITGEVVGERPMTQNKKSLMLTEVQSGLKGKILRPLSAKLLKPSSPVQKGWINRKELYDINGRSRKPQLGLAREFNIDRFPAPAGGCLLTDPNFSKRLKDAIEYSEDSLKEILLLRLGRHFRFHDGAKVIVGRDEKENRIIEVLKPSLSICLEADSVPSPITLLLNSKKQKDIELAASLCLRYSDSKEKEGKVNYWKERNKIVSLVAEQPTEETIEKFRIQ